MKYNRVGSANYPGGTEFTTKRNEEKARNARFVAKMEGLVRRWDLEVDKLAARGEGAAAEVREAGLARVATMRAEGEAARSSLRNLRYATQASSRGLMIGCERAWTSMTTALAKLSAETPADPPA
jgi:hypothetical protein